MTSSILFASLLLALFLASCGRSAAATIKIDWYIPSEPYQALEAKVGDRVKFTWQYYHNVYLHPSSSCDVAGSTLVGHQNGKTGTYEFERPGTYTFACHVSGHCRRGMIVDVVVSTPAPTEVVFPRSKTTLKKYKQELSEEEAAQWAEGTVRHLDVELPEKDQKIGAKYRRVEIAVESQKVKKKDLQITATYQFYYDGEPDLGELEDAVEKSVKSKKLSKKYIGILEDINSIFSGIKRTKLVL